MELDPANFAERLVSGMSDAIIYADAEGVIRVWNRGATRVFGFAEAEAVGRPLDIIIPENLRERHWQGYRATMRTGQSPYGDGSTTPLTFNATSSPDPHCGSSVPKLLRSGKVPSQRHERMPCLDLQCMAEGVAVTKPSGHLRDR